MVCLCGVMEDPDMGTDTRKWPAQKQHIANTNFPLRVAVLGGIDAAVSVVTPLRSEGCKQTETAV